MLFEEAKTRVADALTDLHTGRVNARQQLLHCLMIALDKLDTTSDEWMEEVLSLFTGVPSSLFWEIDGMDASGPRYCNPPISMDPSICRPPAEWHYKLRTVRNSNRQLFDALVRG